MLETSEMAALGINDEWGNCVISFPKIKSAQILKVIHLRVDQEMMNRCRKTDRTKQKLLTLHALRKNRAILLRRRRARGNLWPLPRSLIL